MSEMYEYLEKHAYISKNKKSNYQFELTKERAECIANKHNSLCEEKDKEIERLNNILNELEKFTNARIQKCYDEGCYIEEFNIYCEYDSKIKELRGDNK